MRPRTRNLFNSNASSSHIGLARVLLSAGIALLLVACSDPGSGGSGIPSGVAINTPPVTPDPNSPSAAPGLVNPSTQRVEVVEADAVTIGGIRYLDSQLEVGFADGSVANFTALKVGQSVVISQSPSMASMLRWKVTIQAL